MSGPRVLFYVQYLEGIGHVVRAKRIVEELCRAGCPVSLVLGGYPIDGFSAGDAKLCQLPPVSASPESYSRLLQPNGNPVDEAYRAARRTRLLAEFDAFQPDIVVTEAYPMGRWAMDFELLPLLQRIQLARPRPMLVASLRDILQMPKTSEKSDRSIELFEKYYDHMLIHGDPCLVRIEDSFPPLQPLLDRATYTGLVVPCPQPAPASTMIDPPAKFDVLVSAGGGAISHAILKTAILAKPLTCLDANNWLALAGPRMPAAEFDELAQLASDNQVQLKRYMPDLSGLMATAQVSIQRAGYNTAADMITARCRSVLIPDSADRQMEQPLRAAKLAELGLAIVLPEAQLSPTRLAQAVQSALRLPRPDVKLDVGGASASAKILVDLFTAHKRHQNS